METSSNDSKGLFTYKGSSFPWKTEIVQINASNVLAEWLKLINLI